MPSFCAVATCNDRYGHSENISFHKFPLKRLHLLKQWEEFIQKQRGEDWHASKWSSLCSRHFREDDFKSLHERRTLKKTAVPTILDDNGLGSKEAIANNTGDKALSNKDIEKSKNKTVTPKVIEPCENTREKEFKEILAIKERLQGTVVETVNVPKAYCRLCGFTSIPEANFLTNYELYGLIKKCFPTLNIQQEDALPKVMCNGCHKSLEEFGLFVDRVSTAQTELQRKFRSKVAEKPLKIKQEPLVRVKQEVAESGYEERQDTNGYGGANDDYDGAIEGGGHEEGDDQKFEFCDFPIINDCDIMEIINLDDPFINIPDDDNTTTVNKEEEIFPKPRQEAVANYMPTAHELLQSHLLIEEHNYAYIDADDFKEERQIYKTEKSDNDERLMEFDINQSQEQQHPPLNYNTPAALNQEQQTHSHNFDSSKRALKPIVTSVSAIQQPSKSSSNGIVVLNESIVKSGCGFQLHACMVCQLKFFSVESLKQHYTQMHGTPMVTVPSVNIPLERVTQNTCKTEKDLPELNNENITGMVAVKNNETDINNEVCNSTTEKENNLEETKSETPDNFGEKQETENQIVIQSKINTPQDSIALKLNQEQISKTCLMTVKPKPLSSKNKKSLLKIPLKSRKTQNISLNSMANQYQQLRKLYQKLQKKCTNLEQNVEQLQLMPPPQAPQPPLAAPTHKIVSLNNNKDKTKHKPLNKPKIIKTKILPKLKSSETLENNLTSKTLTFSCAECSKSFANSNSLRQHKITHTEERKHHCTLCQRTFKRRNGLLQHLKGFHLQVKPFCCPVCKHSYALKCDMLRCKHSILRNFPTSTEKPSSASIKARLVLKKLEK